MIDRTETNRPEISRNQLSAWWDRWDCAIVWVSLIALSVMFWWFVWRFLSSLFAGAL